MGKNSSDKKTKEKKEKKEKRAEANGIVKVKKEKKSKKSDDNAHFVNAIEQEFEKAPEDSMVKFVTEDVAATDARQAADLVPFAFPLLEDAKDIKKTLKTVKKSAKNKSLRRGVKEVVKALRKSSSSAPSSSSILNPSHVVIIAADISPMDVISHLPVLCEDHNIPYVYIKSRADLGEASATKRPTSVVMVGKERASKKGTEGNVEDQTEFQEAFSDLVEIAVKASKTVKK